MKRRTGREGVELTVRKNKRVGPTRIGADVSEERGDVHIDRSVDAVDPSRAFGFEFPPGSATTKPSDPFSGSLTPPFSAWS